MLREANLSDFEAVEVLARQSRVMHAESYPDLLWKERFNGDSVKTKEDFEYLIESGYEENGLSQWKIFVFEENGDILGYCITEAWEYEGHPVFRDARVLGIEDIFVDEKARGKGIGRQLFNRAKDYAKEIGAVRMQLAVWDFNKDARKFYENLGMSANYTNMYLKIE